MLLTCLHENLLTRLVRVGLVDQQEQILDYLLKLLVKKVSHIVQKRSIDFQRDCKISQF